ncbi:hypothetical protein FXE87_17320 [Vibrio mimicus]|uniref:hypothetical protein n=1 Tax=Vibrio mimicus TaxID=674 RepID=UPI0001BADBFC|nr:hypothetical protein [Vibrio mimicus]EEY37658.1 hypothetical protein VII_001407 [Vibrio mimicus MB451]ERM54936.1 hypothetical protein P781_12150 [Vibrio mimicus CAIM 1883]ERM54978.1 hypothetical protein P780_12120 [Vibrio mimicus CAIM 1882]TXY08826.1 hypothetical protein FXF05_00045 [Vibrio mimicus]TXY21267.1 hypothetical protein FXE87_17320 [Vibrio mimicus]
MKYWLLLFTLLSPFASSAELYVVASSQSPLMAIDRQELSALYLGRNRVVGNTYINQVLDRTGEIRQRFFLLVTNMQESQVNAYWAKLKFSGRLRAPESIQDEQELVTKLEANPFSIGYTDQPPVEDLKVLLVIYD